MCLVLNGIGGIVFFVGLLLVVNIWFFFSECVIVIVVLLVFMYMGIGIFYIIGEIFFVMKIKFIVNK